MAILVTVVTLAVLLTWRTIRSYYEEREQIRRQYREPAIAIITAVAIILFQKLYTKIKKEREQIRRQYREPIIAITTAVAIILLHKLYTKIKRERDLTLSWQKAGHQKSRTLKDRMASARET